MSKTKLIFKLRAVAFILSFAAMFTVVFDSWASGFMWNLVAALLWISIAIETHEKASFLNEEK